MAKTKTTTTKKAPTRKEATRTKATTTKKAPASKTAKTDGKKLSAIDAAARVLASSKEPMNAKQMIEAMTARKL